MVNSGPFGLPLGSLDKKSSVFGLNVANIAPGTQANVANGIDPNIPTNPITGYQVNMLGARPNSQPASGQYNPSVGYAFNGGPNLNAGTVGFQAQYPTAASANGTAFLALTGAGGVSGFKIQGGLSAVTTGLGVGFCAHDTSSTAASRGLSVGTGAIASYSEKAYIATDGSASFATGVLAISSGGTTTWTDGVSACQIANTGTITLTAKGGNGKLQYTLSTAGTGNNAILQSLGAGQTANNNWTYLQLGSFTDTPQTSSSVAAGNRLILSNWIQPLSTGDITGNYLDINYQPQVTSANTRTHSGSVMLLQRSATTNNASANFTVSAAVLAVVQTYTQTSGTLTMTAPVATFSQASSATGDIQQNLVGATKHFYVKSSGLPGWVAADTQTTVGAAGGASALPATPTGYLKIDQDGTTVAVPYYASA